MRYVAAAFVVLILWLVVDGIRVRREIDSRDELALFEHYAPKKVSILETLEWPSTETCFRFDLRDPRTGTTATKVAKFSGGADQDNWTQSGEYRSMADCKAHFNRG